MNAIPIATTGAGPNTMSTVDTVAPYEFSWGIRIEGVSRRWKPSQYLDTTGQAAPRELRAGEDTRKKVRRPRDDES